MAMYADDGLIDIGYILSDIADEFSEFSRYGIADCIRDIDGRSTGIDDGFDQPVQELLIGSSSIHRREFDV